MSRNEATVAFLLAVLAVAAYSAWGSYLIKSQAAAPVAHVAGISR